MMMPADPTIRWLTIGQAVEVLAEAQVLISAAGIRQWIHRGYLPVERVGRRVLFTEQALWDAERDTRERTRTTRIAVDA